MVSAVRPPAQAACRKAAKALSTQLDVAKAIKAVKPTATLFGKEVPIKDVGDVHQIWRWKLDAAFAEEAISNGDMPPYPWYAPLFVCRRQHPCRVRGAPRHVLP